MAILPLIVGFGGINAAGRSSFHHGYRRLIASALNDTQLLPTVNDLATLMNIDTHGDPLRYRDTLWQGTLIRRIEANHFDTQAVLRHQRLSVCADQPVQLSAQLKTPPQAWPPGWQGQVDAAKQAQIQLHAGAELLMPEPYTCAVQAAGQLPQGFDPGTLYRSLHHPRAIQMTVFAASDAIHSLGIPWSAVMAAITPDQLSVYAGGCLPQMDDHSLRGLMQSALKGERVTSKQIAMSLGEMPADFINSYLINSVGSTGTQLGACASFLYNLRAAVQDIQLKKARVAIVGTSEAPISPEIIEGFKAMGALATDEALAKLDPHTQQVDHRRACRPFSTNAGFTLAESAQFIILMDDELALSLGATVHGMIADVFINADGNKRSISAPGIGNYITFAKATALAQAILGEDLKRSFVQAHGTGTPQNRVTESHIINQVAQGYGWHQWPVCAIKAYVGHSLGSAAGDQMMASLGVWSQGYLPGIATIDHIAEDVHHQNLQILMDHLYVGEQGQDMLAALINAKGFGGNNATGLVLSPHFAQQLLRNKYGKSAIIDYHRKNDAVLQAAKRYDQLTTAQGITPIYQFGEQVMDQQDVRLSREQIQLSRYDQAIRLCTTNPYADYCPPKT